MAREREEYNKVGFSSEELKKNKKKDYTKEDNKAALLAQIDEIEQAFSNGEISFKDKSAQISAIRFRLQDKFELEKSDKEQRIIVVPAKHLFICPHVNRECSNMPPKEVCMKYYGLVEREELDRLQKEIAKLKKTMDNIIC